MKISEQVAYPHEEFGIFLQVQSVAIRNAVRIGVSKQYQDDLALGDSFLALNPDSVDSGECPFNIIRRADDNPPVLTAPPRSTPWSARSRTA